MFGRRSTQANPPAYAVGLGWPLVRCGRRGWLRKSYMRTSGGSHRLRRDMSGGGGADFVANLPTRALEFEARAPTPIDASKILPENRSSAIRKVFEVMIESREGDPGENLGRAFVAGLEESKKTHDSTVSTDDGSAQLAFLFTARPFSTIILARLCGMSLVKQTNATLRLHTDQDYGDAGAEYAAATSVVWINFYTSVRRILFKGPQIKCNPDQKDGG